MSELSASKQETQNVQDVIKDINAWRQELGFKIARVVSFASWPILASALYDWWSGLSVWIVGVKVLLYLLILIYGTWPKFSYQTRAFGIVTVVDLMALIELYIYGWGGDTRIYLIVGTFLSVLFWGSRVGYVMLGTSFLVLLVSAAAYTYGWLSPVVGLEYKMPFLFLALEASVFLMLGGALVAASDLMLPRLIAALRQSIKSSRLLEEEREKLDARTHALQMANMAFQRRAMYLESSAHISQVLTTLFEVEPLLNQAVDLISRSFNFYHTGIFLVDNSGEWAILRAASSEGGRKMLTREHRLRVGGDSMVGWVTEHRKPRIASDVGKDAVHFVNPDLPATRSEMTLPLLVAGHLIGVLDVQSTEENAFDRDDIRTLQGLASQLAIAINNARRLSDEAALLEAASPFYRVVSRLAATRNLREIYAAILEAALDFNPSYTLILRGKPEDSSSVLVVADLQDKQVRYPEKVSEPIFQEIYFLGALLDEPLLVDDTSVPLDETSMMPPELLKRLSEYGGFRSVGLIPIRSEVELQGLMFVTYVVPHQFSPTERQLYRILSSMGGIALERLELMSYAQAQVARDRWLREFTEKLIQIPDLRTVTKEAAQILQNSVGAKGVIVSLHPFPVAEQASESEESSSDV